MTDRVSTQPFVFVGTYTYEGSQGIYAYRLEYPTGKLTPAGITSGIASPSFLTLDSQHRYLYAVNELDQFQGEHSGGLSAFSIDPETAELELLNQRPSHGTSPCHLAVDRTDRFLIATNYGSGSVCVVPIRADGTLGEATDLVQHSGRSIHPQRQTGPHAHSITLDPTNRYSFVADLGLDRVMIYQLDLVSGKLVPNDPPWVAFTPGAGPRHLAFHPLLQHAYVVNELDSNVTVLAYDPETGSLRPVQSLSTLPDSFDGPNTCADVHVEPGGRFLYGSNRGHDSIAIFAIDQRTGELDPIGHQSTLGETPRNFAIDPSGALLLAANQDTDSIVSFHLDSETGGLTPTGQVTQVSMPVCVKIVSLAP